MWKIILWFTFFVAFSSASFVVEVNKKFKPCHNSRSLFPWDLSKLQLFLNDEDQLVMNGPLPVVTDIVPPVGLNLYTRKLEQGDWMPTPYGKQVLNFCDVILARHELWYPITKHMNNTRCPIRKGEESFNMVQLGKFDLEDVLAELVGEWRVFIEITLRGVPPKVSCIMTEVSILEH